jgi:spore coat polysaccharide biosynthesis protein SpsF (cytidylyltransferase family)
MVDICGRPKLGHILDRYRLDSDRATHIIVATTQHKADDAVAAFCADEGVPCYRQPDDWENVTARLDTALRLFAPDADYVFRAMADCPFAEMGLVDWMADILHKRQADVVWIGLPDDPWPIYGARESPWSREAWDQCAERSQGGQCEHPGGYIYDHLQDYRVLHTQPLRDEYYRPHRLELDTEKDLAVIRKIYEALWTGPGHVISMLQAIKWLDKFPDVAALNAEVPLKSLTRPDWRRRGIDWKCKAIDRGTGGECGASLPVATVIRKGCLETVCQRCGARREFVEVGEYRRGRG